MTGWPLSRILDLCERYGAGEPLGSIGRDYGVTRGAVIGKWNRLAKGVAHWPEAYFDAFCEMVSEEVPFETIGEALCADIETLHAAFALIRRQLGEQAV